MTSILNSRGFTAWKNGRNPCQRMCHRVLQGRLFIVSTVIGTSKGMHNSVYTDAGVRITIDIVDVVLVAQIALLSVP